MVQDMKKSQDYYSLLGVSRTATKEEIQKAYRKLARKYHPDVNKERDAEEVFKNLNEAQSVLSDPEKRKLYDRFGKNWQQAAQAGAGDRATGGEPWRNFGGGFRYEEAEPFGEEGYEDLFSQIFGGGRRQQRSWSSAYQSPGSTVEAELEVTLQELAHGATKTISWNAMERSDGTVRPVEQKVQLRVPRGLKDGSVIRLSGKGEKGRGGAPDGDLLLTLRVRPDRRFALQEYDLHTSVPVSAWEAALGGKVPVETLDGVINLSIPKGCKNGRMLRVKGKGLPHKNGAAGDLLVQVEIYVPRNLSEEERRHFEELQRISSFDPRASLGQRAADVKKKA